MPCRPGPSFTFLGTGVMVAAARGFGQAVSSAAFDPVQIQGRTFNDGYSMRRYIVGAMLMGLGSMRQMRIGLLALLAGGVLLATGCRSESKRDCPDPVAQSSEYMTETEKKLARIKTGFDPNCK